MSEEIMVNNEELIEETKGGKVTFANEVIATIASLAASEVQGIATLNGTAFEGLGEKLGRRSYTKGVKVEVGTLEAAVDLAVTVKYGFKIHDVCVEVQNAVKTAIETMTGLKVVEVNINVAGIQIEKAPKEPEEPREEVPARVK